MALPTAPPFNPVFNYPSNKLYQYEVYPVLLSCTFTVDSSTATGISNLTGSGFANVFMHSGSPDVGNYGYENPNPAAGIIVVQLQNNFSKLLNAFALAQPPLSGSDVTVGSTTLTAGAAYTITDLGNTTTATWQRLGFPPGFTPTVGAAFIASGSAHGSAGTGKVQLALVSGIANIEVVSPSMIPDPSIYTFGGNQIIFQALAATSSSVTTPIPTAPADGTVIRLSLYLSNSGVTVNGQ